MGETPATIEQEFVVRGLEAEAARRIIAAVEATRQSRQLSAGRRNMIFGGGTVVVGIFATAFTFALVAEGGGYFYIFPLAVVGGALQFIYGWVQIRTA